MQDVWDVVDLLIEEVKHFNNEGKSFDVSRSINAQLPFLLAKTYFTLKKIKQIFKDTYTAKTLILNPIQVVMVSNLFYG